MCELCARRTDVRCTKETRENLPRTVFERRVPFRLVVSLRHVQHGTPGGGQTRSSIRSIDPMRSAIAGSPLAAALPSSSSSACRVSEHT